MEKPQLKCISTITDGSPQFFISKSEAGAKATFFFSSPMIHDRYKQDKDDLNLFNWSDCNELWLDLFPLCCSEVTDTSDVRKPSYWKGLCPSPRVADSGAVRGYFHSSFPFPESQVRAWPSAHQNLPNSYTRTKRDFKFCITESIKASIIYFLNV